MIVTIVGRVAVDAEVPETRVLKRTAKACGPDVAVLASRFEEANASEGRRRQKSRSPGRARDKP